MPNLCSLKKRRLLFSLKIRYASQQGISFAIIADHEELAREEIILRGRTEGREMRFLLAQVLEVLKHPDMN
ncbi:His/Gly/Thr/Pro-type tRNA ligase C-terminal domain-containing protein [Holospora curviuscula]|uniref:His/Gly/Thr/Pro-type tRNA ligase C-terminal domain-containing protein n=1 Tax=Holospora curviuscula TaxID=1082868 RepID=UPI00101AE788